MPSSHSSWEIMEPFSSQTVTISVWMSKPCLFSTTRLGWKWPWRWLPDPTAKAEAEANRGRVARAMLRMLSFGELWNTKAVMTGLNDCASSSRSSYHAQS